MPIRMTDTEIWEEDWFIDLPNEYKLFYLFIKDKCDHSGMWRPNRRKFSMSVHGKLIMYEEFLQKVNHDPETQSQVKRIIVLENGKWFITRFVSFQLGGKFRIKIGAHRGALELLIRNGVHPKDVPKMDWSGMELLDMEEHKKLAYGKGYYTLSIGQGKAMHSEIEREIDPDNRNKGKGVVGEKPSTPIFKMQDLYDLPWNALDARQLSQREFKDVTEPDFKMWKEFVDFVVEKNFIDLFRATFPHPADFRALVYKNGFTKEKWEPVIAKMLSTGIQPQHNLYFRIPDFMKYAKVKPGADTSMNAGTGETDYKNMDKW